MPSLFLEPRSGQECMSDFAHCFATLCPRSQKDSTLVPVAGTAGTPTSVPASQIPLVLFVQDKVDSVDRHKLTNSDLLKVHSFEIICKF